MKIKFQNSKFQNFVPSEEHSKRETKRLPFYPFGHQSRNKNNFPLHVVLLCALVLQQLKYYKNTSNMTPTIRN